MRIALGWWSWWRRMGEGLSRTSFHLH
jgi:hypothetical protein